MTKLIYTGYIYYTRSDDVTNNVEDFKKTHLDNYRRALVDTLVNNTNALFDEDIASLLKKPPLDSMDVIKSRFLDLAKKNKIILNAEKLDSILDNYRSKCLEFCKTLKDIRINTLSKIINDFKLINNNDTIKLMKKDFSGVNKTIKSEIKNFIKDTLNTEIFEKMDLLFDNDVDLTIKKRIITDVTKYVNNNYLKQLLENIDFKILVKDTILTNSIKEQGERYLFTLENSRLFDVQ